MGHIGIQKLQNEEKLKNEETLKERKKKLKKCSREK